MGEERGAARKIVYHGSDKVPDIILRVKDIGGGVKAFTGPIVEGFYYFQKRQMPEKFRKA